MKDNDVKILKNLEAQEKPVPSSNSKPNIAIEAPDGTIDIYTSDGRWIGFKRKGV